MSTTLPVTFRGAPLNPEFTGNLQQFFDAIVERLSIESQDDLSFFVSGSVAPSSNVGPWIKDGLTWYVWDVITGSYIPQVIDFQSLRYIAQAGSPDQNKYVFWIKLDGTGKATGIYYYSGGAWKDVYEDKFATYSTTVEMNAAIAAAIAAAAYNSHPAGAYATGTQVINVDSSYHKLEMNVELYDPGSNYDTTLYRYTAPVNGIYNVTAHTQIDNVSGDAATMEVAIKVGKNGNTSINGLVGGTSVATPPGLRWYPSLAGGIQLNAGDYLEVFVSLTDTVLTGTTNSSNGDWSVTMVKAL